MKKSIWQCIENRKQERLIQGLLLYLLNNDNSFNESFARWLNLESSILAVKEEIAEEQRRHDLVLYLKDQRIINIELKLWAEFTNNQINTPLSIDFAIVPKVRKNTVGFLAEDKIKTWEEFHDLVVSKSELAKLLFADLIYYIYSGQIYSKSDFQVDFRLLLNNYNDSDCYSFLSNIQYKVYEYDLSVGNICGNRNNRFYYGFYIKNEKLKIDTIDWKNWLWFGFISNISQDGTISKPELILQVLSDKIESKFESELGEFDKVKYPWLAYDKGLLIESNNGQYLIDDIWGKMKSAIIQYSKFENINI